MYTKVILLILYYIVGCKDAKQGKLLKDMFQADYFRIVVCEDKKTVEVCGALKVCIGIVVLSHNPLCTANNFLLSERFEPYSLTVISFIVSIL